MTDWDRVLPEIELGREIPKVLYQTITHVDSLPDAVIRNIEYIKASNPGWTYHLFSGADRYEFIEKNYQKEVLRQYTRISEDYPAAQADLFRYLLLYANGGMYLDIKSSIAEPIDSFLTGRESFVVTQWDNAASGPFEHFGRHAELAHVDGGEYQQWHVIAAKGHPFLRAVLIDVLSNIESYRPWTMGVGRIGVLRLTGPIAFTRAIHPILSQHPHTVIGHGLPLVYSVGNIYGPSRMHYSRRTTPVVHLPMPARALVPLFNLVKSARDRLTQA